MAIPGQVITIKDPSLGLTEPISDLPLFIGTSFVSANYNVVKAYNDPNTVRDELGYCELSEAIIYALKRAGGPVYGMVVAGTGAQNSAVTTGSAVSATLSGTPHFSTTVLIEILTGGAPGTATFRYTYDGFVAMAKAYGLAWAENLTVAWSDEIVVPVGMIYVFDELGVTIIFDDNGGTEVFEAGETFTFDTTQDHVDSTALATAFNAVRTTYSSLYFPLIFVASTPATAADAAAIFSALDTELEALANVFKYSRAYISAGSEGSVATLAAFANLDSVRIGVVASACGYVSAAPSVGKLYSFDGGVGLAATRAISTLISTDQARFAEGPIPGIIMINPDGYQDPTMDSAGFITFRTWPNASGYYITNGRLKAPFGSDYQYLQYGRIMDRACVAIQRALQPFIAEGFRTLPGTGAIDPRDAADIRSAGINALKVALLDESNARGTGGHVSSIDFQVNLTNNVATSGVIYTTVTIQPLGYAREINQTIGFVVADAE